jgi:hypothetical protein
MIAGGMRIETGAALQARDPAGDKVGSGCARVRPSQASRTAMADPAPPSFRKLAA